MKRILNIIEAAQEKFHSMLEAVDKDSGVLKEEQYARFLRNQYHLNKNVQRHFYIAASHPDLAHRASLKKFLINFGNEEEPHYEIAKKDLENFGHDVGTAPFDVQLWWSYYDTLIHDRPFVRLGGTCILENISEKSGPLLDKLLSKATYLTPRNSRYLIIHKHGDDLPHGAQILEALSKARLEERHLSDLEEGASKAVIMYLRMMEWALFEKNDPSNLKKSA